jgi:hypothetical protein
MKGRIITKAFVIVRIISAEETNGLLPILSNETGSIFYFKIPRFYK